MQFQALQSLWETADEDVVRREFARANRSSGSNDSTNTRTTRTSGVWAPLVELRGAVYIVMADLLVQENNTRAASISLKAALKLVPDWMQYVTWASAALGVPAKLLCAARLAVAGRCMCRSVHYLVVCVVVTSLCHTALL